MKNDVLTIEDLHISHDTQQVVAQLNLAVKKGEIVALLGASGCGKTTTLKAIAGLLTPDQGAMHLAGKKVNGRKLCLPPQQRQVGMIFQDYALFPHLTVAENITFAFEKMPKPARQDIAEKWLQQVSLNGLGQRYPHQLSGGQQQRVAVARALAAEPQLLLMDEPFSNIDAQVRLQLAEEVRSLLKQSQTSAILVTHSREEAMAVADKIALMHQGRIVQFGTPQQLYHQPLSLMAAEFMGEGSAFTLQQGRDGWSTPLLPGQVFTLPQEAKQATLFLRPHQLSLKSGAQGQVLEQRFLGGRLRTQVQIDATRYMVDVDNSQVLERGSDVDLVMNTQHPIVIQE